MVCPLATVRILLFSGCYSTVYMDGGEMKKRDLRHLVHKPYSVNLYYTDVGKRIENEQKRLAKLAKKPHTVVQLKRKGAK